MLVNGHDPWKLTKSWLTMSNDSFYEIYGFSWVPPMFMQNKVKEEIMKDDPIKFNNF